VTMRFTRSACDRYTRAFVFRSLRYCVPVKKVVIRLLLELESSAAGTPAALLRDEYSTSKTRTSESPAHVTKVWSFEWGMNFTEKMFALWPVAIVVLRAKGTVDESG
jgi:hypothetical protein